MPEKSAFEQVHSGFRRVELGENAVLRERKYDDTKSAAIKCYSHLPVGNGSAVGSSSLASLHPLYFQKQLKLKDV